MEVGDLGDAEICQDIHPLLHADANQQLHEHVAGLYHQEDPIPVHCTLEVLVLQQVACGYYSSHHNSTTICLGNRISTSM
jgi:hypothetical protein